MRTKSIIALLVLLLGTGGSLWIAYPNAFKSNAPSTLSFASSTGEKDPRFTNESAALTAGAPNDISEENVVRNYGMEILRLNPQGQGKDVPIKLPTEEVLTQMLQDEMSKPIPIRTYAEKDIVVIKSTDKKSVLAYAAAVDAANKKTIGSLDTTFVPAIMQFVANNDPQALSLHSNAISADITALLAIPVPQNWKTFHLALINVLGKRLAYADAILGNNGSQLKVAAALSNIIALVDEEVELYNTMPKQ